MSRIRVMRNGKPAWAPNEPGFVARPKGYGGSQLGWFSGTVVAVVPRRGEPSPGADRQLREREPQP